MDYIALGKNIAEARKAKKMTQEQLAETVDISTVFVSQIETAARKPSLETMEKLAKVLDTTIDALIDNQNRHVLENDFTALMKGKTESEVKCLLKIINDICEYAKKQ